MADGNNSNKLDPGYHVQDGCHVHVDGDGGVTWLSNFVAEIVREYIVDDGETQTRTYEVSVTHYRRTWRCRVPAEAFDAMKWVADHTDCKVSAYPYKERHLAYAIRKHSKADVIVSYSHTGWRKIGNEWVYLHGGGAISKSGPVQGIEIESDPGLKLSQYTLGPQLRDDKLAKGLDLVEKVLKLTPDKPWIAAALVGAAFRAVLPLVDPVDFAVCIVGPTGSRKTELAAVVQRFFGQDFHSRNLPENWESTETSLERKAYHYKDSILTIDDFRPQGSSGSVDNYHRKAERVIRGQGNIAGRSRSRSDGTAGTCYWPRGMILMTAEDLPRGSSLLARMIVLDLDDGDVDLDVLTEIQESGDLLSRAMSTFLQWAARHRHLLPETMPAYRSLLRRELEESGVQCHARTPDNVTSLACGNTAFWLFSRKQGRFANSLDSGAILESQPGSVGTENEVERFVQYMRTALSTDRARLDGINGCASVGSGGTRIGWVDDEHVYLDDNAAYGCAHAVARAQGRNVEFSQDRISKLMKSQGWITESEGNRHKKRVTIAPGKRPRAVWIDRARLLDEEPEDQSAD